jgi:hypothetical protein
MWATDPENLKNSKSKLSEERTRHFCLQLYLSNLVSCGEVRWVHLVRRPLTGLLYLPRTIDDECGAVGGMRIGRGNQSTRRKPAQAPLYATQIPHHLTWDRTRVAAVGSQRLTSWAMARPLYLRKHPQNAVFSLRTSGNQDQLKNLGAKEGIIL